jgi:ribonucleotide monophosphatase NagD (HAD superfamily)
MPGGGIPDAGATLAALEHLTGRKVELIAGKPSRLILDVALESLSLPAKRCLLTGDRLETDIRMAKEAGMRSAVVLTGASTRKQAAKAQPCPDMIFENLEEMITVFGLSNSASNRLS